jgi:hypothetical protein
MPPQSEIAGREGLALKLSTLSLVGSLMSSQFAVFFCVSVEVCLARFQRDHLITPKKRAKTVKSSIFYDLQDALKEQRAPLHPVECQFVAINAGDGQHVIGRQESEERYQSSSKGLRPGCRAGIEQAHAAVGPRWHGPCGRASKGRAGEAPSRPLQMRWQGRVPTRPAADVRRSIAPRAGPPCGPASSAEHRISTVYVIGPGRDPDIFGAPDPRHETGTVS